MEYLHYFIQNQLVVRPDVVTYPIAHELDPPPWHTAYPTNVRTYPIWKTQWHTASKQALFLLGCF